MSKITSSNIFSSDIPTSSATSPSKENFDKFKPILTELNLEVFGPVLEQKHFSKLAHDAERDWYRFSDESKTEIPFNDLTRYLHFIASVCVEDRFSSQELKDKLATFKVEINYSGFIPVSYPPEVQAILNIEYNFKIMFILKHYNKFKHMIE